MSSEDDVSPSNWQNSSTYFSIDLSKAIERSDQCDDLMKGSEWDMNTSHILDRVLYKLVHVHSFQENNSENMNNYLP